MSAKIHSLPESWLLQFRQVVDQIGASEVARRLECSASTISQIYHDKYPSPLDKWQARFLAEFAPGRVDCPVLGEISRETCSFHRKRDFAATNPTRVRLFHACQNCINNPDRVDE